MVAEIEPLADAEGLDLREREVLREPAGDLLPVDPLALPPVPEVGPVAYVRGSGDLVLMPGDQDPVPGDDEVGLDEVRPHLDGQLVRRERVLGPVPAGAAVGDDDGAGGGLLQSSRRSRMAFTASSKGSSANNCSRSSV